MSRVCRRKTKGRQSFGSSRIVQTFLETVHIEVCIIRAPYQRVLGLHCYHLVFLFTFYYFCLTLINILLEIWYFKKNLTDFSWLFYIRHLVSMAFFVKLWIFTRYFKFKCCFIAVYLYSFKYICFKFVFLFCYKSLSGMEGQGIGAKPTPWQLVENSNVSSWLSYAVLIYESRLSKFICIHLYWIWLNLSVFNRNLLRFIEIYSYLLVFPEIY